MSLLLESPLGRSVTAESRYRRELLCAVPRAKAREMIGLQEFVFCGFDLWQAFEFSWLGLKGKPEIAMVRFLFDAMSPYLIESKSFKLYLQSFQMERLSKDEVVQRLREDLSQISQSSVQILWTGCETLVASPGVCLDDLDIDVEVYDVNPGLLQAGPLVVEEAVYTDLFKANCLVTGQPDWATIEIAYRGPCIDHASLLRYLISYRNHKGLHEQCVEQIFTDLHGLGLEKLTVQGRFTRRGGLDINPLRSTEKVSVSMGRLVRQ